MTVRGRLQAVGGVHPDRPEQPVGRPALVHDQRLPDEGGERIVRVAELLGHDGACPLHTEGSTEGSEREEQLRLAVPEQDATGVQGCSEGALSPRPARRQGRVRRAVGDPLPDHGGAEHVGVRRGELDGEGNAFDAADHLGNISCGPCVKVEVGAHPSGTVQEELEGRERLKLLQVELRSLGRYVERVQPVDDLFRQAKGPSARREDREACCRFADPVQRR